MNTQTNISLSIEEKFDILNNPLLAYTTLLAQFIRHHTSYNIEVSWLLIEEYEDGVFFQIDEINNYFYFTFFENRIEFAIGNFDDYKVMSIDNLLSPNNLQMLTDLKSLGANDELMKSCTLFLNTMSLFTKKITT